MKNRLIVGVAGVLLFFAFTLSANAQGYTENYWGIRFTGMAAPYPTPPLLPQVQMGQEFFNGAGSFGWRVSWFPFFMADAVDAQLYYRFFTSESTSMYAGIGGGALMNVNINTYATCPAIPGASCTNSNAVSFYFNPMLTGVIGFVYEPVAGLGWYAEAEPTYFFSGTGLSTSNIAVLFSLGVRFSY